MVHHFLQLAAFEIINDDLLKPGLFLLTSSLCLPTGLLLERKILQMIFVEKNQEDAKIRLPMNNSRKESVLNQSLGTEAAFRIHICI